MPYGIGWWPSGRTIDLRPARFACWVITKVPLGRARRSSRRRPVRALAVAPPANPAPQRRAKVIGGASTFTEIVTIAATSLS